MNTGDENYSVVSSQNLSQDLNFQTPVKMNCNPGTNNTESTKSNSISYSQAELMTTDN